MYKFVVLAVVLAVANGAHVPVTYVAAQPLVHHQVVQSPVVYQTAAVHHNTVPLATTYTAGVHHTPVVHSHTPVVYSAHHTVPVVHTSHKVVQTHKPVEQHGYQIAY